jgi:hypothetical protein
MMKCMRPQPERVTRISAAREMAMRGVAAPKWRPVRQGDLQGMDDVSLVRSGGAGSRIEADILRGEPFHFHTASLRLFQAILGSIVQIAVLVVARSRRFVLVVENPPGRRLEVIELARSRGP